MCIRGQACIDTYERRPASQPASQPAAACPCIAPGHVSYMHNVPGRSSFTPACTRSVSLMQNCPLPAGTSSHWQIWPASSGCPPPSASPALSGSLSTPLSSSLSSTLPSSSLASSLWLLSHSSSASLPSPSALSAAALRRRPLLPGAAPAANAANWRAVGELAGQMANAARLRPGRPHSVSRSPGWACSAPGGGRLGVGGRTAPCAHSDALRCNLLRHVPATPLVPPAASPPPPPPTHPPTPHTHHHHQDSPCGHGAGRLVRVHTHWCRLCQHRT